MAEAFPAAVTEADIVSLATKAGWIEMTSGVPRGIAVVDIGATNSKVALFDAGLQEIARRKTETVHHDGPPYRHIDAERIVEFAIGAIGELDRVLPVDVIVVSACGSTLGCIDETGALATPVMDYLAEPPAEIAEAYVRSRLPSRRRSATRGPPRCRSAGSSTGSRPPFPRRSRGCGRS